jgi:putative redox protein
MAEHVIVRQDREFRTKFWVEEETEVGNEKMQEADHIHQLNPYSMMLSSLGSCTAIVLNTYAEHHRMPLEGVEIELFYNRNYRKDCDTCEQTGNYSEEVVEQMKFLGQLTDKEKDKLLRIAHACPIYKMFKEGIPIRTELQS